MFIIFLLRDAPDRIKISSDRDLIRFEVVVYTPFHFKRALLLIHTIRIYIALIHAIAGIYTNNTLIHTLYINL